MRLHYRVPGGRAGDCFLRQDWLQLLLPGSNCRVTVKRCQSQSRDVAVSVSMDCGHGITRARTYNFGQQLSGDRLVERAVKMKFERLDGWNLACRHGVLHHAALHQSM